METDSKGGKWVSAGVTGAQKGVYSGRGKSRSKIVPRRQQALGKKKILGLLEQGTSPRSDKNIHRGERPEGEPHYTGSLFGKREQEVCPGGHRLRSGTRTFTEVGRLPKNLGGSGGRVRNPEGKSLEGCAQRRKIVGT